MKIANPVRIFEDDSGATAIEYGLIAGLVSVVCIAALSSMGEILEALFNRVAAELAAALA